MPVKGIIEAALFTCLLLAASLWDVRKRTIPDSLCALVALTGILTFTPGKPAGGLLCLPLLIAALANEGGMGGGDVKLTAACGFVLGLPAGCAGLILGLTASLVWYGISKAVHKLKRIPIKPANASALPLAPFLSLGFIAAETIKITGGIPI